MKVNYFSRRIFASLTCLTLFVPDIRKPPHSSYSLHESRFPFPLFVLTLLEALPILGGIYLLFHFPLAVESGGNVNRAETGALAGSYRPISRKTQLIDALKESYVDGCF